MKNSILLLLLFAIPEAYSQGCSDAGVCTLASPLKDSTVTNKNTIEVGYIFAKGYEDVVYNNGFINYGYSFPRKWAINAKVTYNQANGTFGTRGCLGDAFITANYTNKLKISTLLGVKIPLNSANLKINGVPLPMDYQSSLGTFDAVAGIEYQYKKWNVDAGIQLPVFQSNRNSYFDEYSASDIFPTTNLFRRKPDALLRGSYTINTNNLRWTFRPSMLAIYHFGNDTYVNIFGKRQEIKDSKGLTLNASMVTHYKINSKHMVLINLSAPLVVRDIRPDGLTRSFIASLSHQCKF
jgi:hypothetical protein